MEAREFYDKRIKEDSTIGSVQLMEEYAKHVAELNFCDGSPLEFSLCTIDQLESMHGKVSMLVDWINE